LTPPTQCRAFAPGSIGNLACGFDVIGLALEGPGDTVLAEQVEEPGVRIRSILGDGGRLPNDVNENTAGAAALAVLDEVQLDGGVELDLQKGLPLAAGMGGSAASAVAAVVAVNGLLGDRLPQELLLQCALAGESVATGPAGADNAGASLFGGLVLVPDWEPRRAIALEVPWELTAAHVHPQVAVNTAEARDVLGQEVPLADAVAQWGNTAALVAGLFRGDWDVIARAVEDRVAEPHRAGAVPGFYEVKKAALEAGALAASLSGSGPSLFALCRGRERAAEVGKRMVDTFREVAGVGADLLVSSCHAPGARLIAAGSPNPSN